MSYEGYERVLCRAGHLHQDDCYMSCFERDWRCPDCGEPRVWWEGVDQTNDAGTQTTLVLHQQHLCCCDKCDSAHQTAPTQYCIPGKPDPQNPEMMLPINPVPLVPIVRCGCTVLETGEEFDTEEEAYRRHHELWEEADLAHQQMLEDLGLATSAKTDEHS